MQHLECEHEIELTPTAPFNFDATLHKPDHFPSADNCWAPGTRWQTMRWEGQRLGLKFCNGGDIDRPRILLNVYAEKVLNEDFLARLLAEIDYRYNFSLDLSEFYRCFKGDPRLEPLIHRWHGMRPVNCNSLYEYLIIAIVLQNATVRRSVSMLQSLFESFGRRLCYDGQELYSYWEPEDLAGETEENLRRLKVGYRAKSILRVTQAILNGQIDEFSLRAEPITSQREALLSLYGIGPASVGYVLADVFHRLDEMEHISPWEQKIYTKLFFDRQTEDPVPVKQLLDYFSKHFAGYRMLAVHYVWEDLWWRRKNEPVDWLEKLIRL